MRISDWSSDVCSSDLADAAMPCLFGNKAERSHARLGVDLKEIQAFHALAVVPAKIGARAALAAQRLVRGQGHVHRRLRNIRRNLRRADMGGEDRKSTSLYSSH